MQALFYRPTVRFIALDGGPMRRLVGETAIDGLPVRAAAGVDFAPPFNIAPGARTIAVTKFGHRPSGGTPLKFSFYAQTL